MEARLTTLETPNTNGGWRQWQVWLALASILLTLATVVYHAAYLNAQVEGRLTRLEEDETDNRKEFARREIMDERLKGLENGIERIEEQTKELSNKFDHFIESKHGN